MKGDVFMPNDMKMPWSVRIALGWFVLLAIVCCVPLVYVQTLWREGWGLGWMLWQHVVCLGYIALGVGFVAAILCGRRNWVSRSAVRRTWRGGNLLDESRISVLGMRRKLFYEN